MKAGWFTALQHLLRTTSPQSSALTRREACTHGSARDGVLTDCLTTQIPITSASA